MILLRQPELRALETRHAAATPPLMERAGRAAAALALARFGRARTLVCAGPGNNGGDAFVLARELAAAGCEVHVLFRADPAHLPADARRAWESCRRPARADFCTEPPGGDFGLVVDGLFGIGLTRDIGDEYAKLIHRINAFPGPVLALDVPSGLDADTGAVRGVAVRATLTASFIAGKPGLFTLDGPDHAGEVVVLDLGLDPGLGGRSAPTAGRLLAPTEFAAHLNPRPRNSHKGSFGSLAVIGGAPGMAGAALLAARAGLQLGAGRVYVGLLERLTFDPAQPELMLREAGDALAQATAAVVGPGLGASTAALDLLRRAATADFPLLLDADALNLLAAHPVLAAQVARRKAPTLLTPHPAEAARLLGVASAAIQADRIAAACELARRFNAGVALKGCGTVLARADGAWRINTTGNAGLASAGTGDVLAGMTGALLAQGWPAWPALCGAANLHGAAADALVAAGTGPVGLTAGELIPAARALLNRSIAKPDA